MRMRSDGSFQSSNTPTWDNVGLKEDYAMYRCMVTKVFYTDDPQNFTQKSQNPEVLYQVVILGGFRGGQLLSNVRLASWLGGDSNFSERTLRPTSKKLTDGLSTHDGDVVFVEFIQGHQGYPIIIALGNSLNSTYGTTSAIGPRSLSQYNGFKQEINNKGEFTITQYLGSLNNLQVFVPGTVPNITEQYLQNEVFVRTFKSGLSIREDGKNDQVTITLKNGATVLIDGSSDTIKLKTAGSAEVNLVGGKVAVGASGTELLAQISQQLQTLIDFLNNDDSTHTHLGNLGYPTGAPINAAQFAAAASSLSGIKSAIDGIKGSL